MLKIKENVDLKELKKFGFVKYHLRENHDYYMYPNIDSYAIYIFVENREIMINNNNFYDYDLNIIYDLIKANLVYKVR